MSTLHQTSLVGPRPQDAVGVSGASDLNSFWDATFELDLESGMMLMPLESTDSDALLSSFFCLSSPHVGGESGATAAGLPPTRLESVASSSSPSHEAASPCDDGLTDASDESENVFGLLLGAPKTPAKTLNPFAASSTLPSAQRPVPTDRTLNSTSAGSRGARRAARPATSPTKGDATEAVNRNAINAKLNRERHKAERLQLEQEVETLRKQLSESQQTQTQLQQQVTAAAAEIQQLQAMLKASPHIGKLLAHMSGLTMSFNSELDAGQKRSASAAQDDQEDEAERFAAKRGRREATTASTAAPFMTIPLQFNLQFVQHA
jgi:hypothetical protein